MKAVHFLDCRSGALQLEVLTVNLMWGWGWQQSEMGDLGIDRLVMGHLFKHLDFESELLPSTSLCPLHGEHLIGLGEHRPVQMFAPLTW